MIEIKKKNDFNLKVDEMSDAGLSFGHRTSKTHPKMKQYISGSKNSVHLIDLEKTSEKLAEALDFAKELITSGKVLLLVGTKIQVRNSVKEAGEAINMPYINNRWLGGTFTNFKTIQKRIDYYKDLKKKKELGELNKYTKKERAKIDKEMTDLEGKFGGIMAMTNLPDAVFVLDMKKDILAVKEARKKGIKIIGISDANIDPTLADYPIPANDDASTSIKYILNKLEEAVKK
jgi:small subunit ribosomal protein S2